MTTTFVAFDGELDTRYDFPASHALGGDHWRVLRSFRYYLGENYSNQWVFVQAGMLTDGASVPQLFWNIIPPWGPYGQAAVVHDLLCRSLTILQDGKPTAITRARCDAILMEAMTVLGVPWAKRWMIYSAVCAYRIVSRTSKPVDSELQRDLEAAWEAHD